MNSGNITFTSDGLYFTNKPTIKKRDDIKFGDIIETINGKKYVFAGDSLHSEDGDCMGIDCEDIEDVYDENLNLDELSWDEEFRIKAIYRDGVKVNLEIGKKKMTVAEICDKLGYDIEIVKEND